MRSALPCLFLFVSLAAFPARARPFLSFSAGDAVPPSSAQACDVLFGGRTARPDPGGSIDVRRIDNPSVVPYTYSNGLVGNTEGFRWYVSAHFALKTDLDDRGATDALCLLETAWPLYQCLFDATPWRCGRGPRIALVLASTREALGRAIVDDDMHVFHLGGITQEGFCAAYLYAGSPYQTRYILLHEATHLYQYCLHANTRGCYGFFVEGIADFFSSHVYDSRTGRLTVNVLDRAPIHNHLLAGLEAWEELGKPSFSELYEKGDVSRGINVLLTAFLQSTPEFEQRWSLYLRGVVANRDPSRAKAVSDGLLRDLYGGARALDAPFRRWILGLRPSYRILSRDFDQDGDSLLSGCPASPGDPARILLPPLAPDDAPFVRDWPSPETGEGLPATNLLRVAVRARVPPPPGHYAEIALCGPEGEALLRCKLVSSEDAGPRPEVTDDGGAPLETFPLAPSSWTNGVTVAFSRSPDPRKPVDVLVTAPGAPPCSSAPSFGADAARRLAAATSPRPRLSATLPGVRFTPRQGTSFEIPALSPCHRASPSRKAPLGRFGASAALSRIYRATLRLGKDAPFPLRPARNDLLARAQGAESALVTDEVLAAPAYWESLAEAVSASRAPEADKELALLDLSGLRLEAGPSPGGAEATLFAAQPYPGEVVFEWSRGGKGKRVARKAAGPETTVALPSSRREPDLRGVKATVRWLGHEIPLAARPAGRGAIPVWHVLGPFRIPGGVFTNATFLPEDRKIDFQLTHARDDGSRLAWQTCRLGDDADRAALGEASVPYQRALWKSASFVGARETLPPMLHFTRLFHRQANDSIAYAAILVDSPAERPALLSLGVTDGVTVLQDGVPILADVKPREWSEGNVRVPVRLSKGRNEFLLKLLHHENVWFLSGSLLETDGAPPEGLSFR